MHFPLIRRPALLLCLAAAAPALLAGGDNRLFTFATEGCVLKLMPGKGVKGTLVVRDYSIDGMSGATLGTLSAVGDASAPVPGKMCYVEFNRGTGGYEVDLGVVPPVGSTPTFHITSKLTGDKIKVDDPSWTLAQGQGKAKIQTSDKTRSLIVVSAFQ